MLEAITSDAAAVVGGATKLWGAAKPVLRCISGLAEGADSLTAEIALDLGYQLGAVLPFSRTDYERDFTAPDSRAEFASLIDRAGTVFELDGSTADPAEAYLAAAQVVLDQSDIMLALWDGLPARGIGGTASVIQEAVGRSIAVLVVNPAQPNEVHWLGGAPDWRPALRSEIERLLLPGRLSTAGSPSSHLATICANGDEVASWARCVCAAYERLILIGPSRSDPETADGAQEAFRRGGLKQDGTGDIGRAFSRADHLAVEYGNRYRAAAILRLTVPLLSVLGVFVGFYGRSLSLPVWAESLGFMLQFFVLAGILGLVYVNNRWAWHAKFLDFRYVAEELRLAEISVLLGTVPPLPNPPPFHSQIAPDWVAWYVRAMVRVPGLVGAKMTQPYLSDVQKCLSQILRDQIRFYENRCRKFKIMARRLNSLANACYASSLVVIALRTIVYFEWPDSPRQQGWANMIALMIPALAPIFIGLRSQGEYARLGGRYESMVSHLQSALVDLQRPRADSQYLRHILRRSASVILTEVSDWRLLIQARQISHF